MNRREIKDPLLLEVVITAVVAIILLLLKQFDLAIVATSIQILITFMTYAIPMKIKNEVYKNIDEHFKILKFSMSIEEEPFKGIKDKIIKDCEDQLELLEKGGVKGETYYIWLNEKINECEKNLKAISSMSCEQWEIPKERAYYAANRDARINRNCDIERIFIINIDELKDEKKRKIILKHLLDGIRVYIVSLGEHIPGMCIFDNKLILIDKEVPPIGVGGRLIKSSHKDFAEQVKEYDRIKLGTRLIEDLDRLSGIINIDIKILWAESCGIIKEICNVKVFEELESKIRDNPDDNFQMHYYKRWKEYCKKLNNQGSPNER